ncbi:MAG TPA: SRPBCC family protein [Alphaproteobacteria bacterium]
MSDTFVYVTYIRTTPEKLWDALTRPEFNRAYWSGMWLDCEWKVGSPWRLMFPDGRVGDAGEVVEVDGPRRMVLSWQNEWKPEFKAEGYSRATFELEPAGDSVKLTVTHSMDREGSKLIKAVSGGWPMILASLKSMLETGEPLKDLKRS